jgi:uncharacterized protein
VRAGGDAAVTQVDVQEPAGGDAGRRISLVDSDIHPQMTRDQLLPRLSTHWRRYYEEFGRRTPVITELYPRASNAGMRADSWPEAAGSYPGSELSMLRAQVLDEYGVDYGVLNCLNLLDCYEVPGFAAELARAINDWMWEDWLDRDPRLLGAIVVPADHPDLSVREIERCAVDERWVQILMPGAPLEPLGSRRYWPIYEAAVDRGLPVCIHNAGYEPHHGSGWPSYYLEEHVAYALLMQSQLLNMVCEGVFDAIPQLKVVLTEGGVTWVVSLRWALDAAWSLLAESAPSLARRPSEVIHEHVWFTTQPIEEPDDPAHFVQALEHGQLDDRLLFATDYPHWDFDSPTQTLPRTVSKELRARILGGTASELYRLPLESRAA